MKQLKYVLVLANEGNFSRAAEVLNISQPSLSQYIKKIENQIGLELFDRSNGDIRLTDAGRIYIDVGRKILNLEHQMEVQLADVAEYKTGSLIIGVSPYRAAGMLPEIAKRFQSIHPRMHLVIREGTTNELIDGMGRAEYDMCLTLLPIDESLCVYEKVMEEELVLVVPVSYPQFDTQEIEGRKYPAIEVSQINGHRFIQLTDTQFMQKQLSHLSTDHDLIIGTAAVVKSLEAQIEMVKAGVGIALVPSSISRFCKDGEVRFYSFCQKLPKREVVVMWRKDRALSQAAKELKEVIMDIKW